MNKFSFRNRFKNRYVSFGFSVFIRETQISKTECPDESGCKLNELSEAIS